VHKGAPHDRQAELKAMVHEAKTATPHEHAHKPLVVADDRSHLRMTGRSQLECS
jgi:hypothetical protein